MQTVASRMKELREALGLSMPAFGRKLGSSRDVIANIEYGRVEPREVFLSHVCEVYGVHPKWLFFGEGTMFDEEAGSEQVREAAALFRSLSPELRELALSQMKSLQKLVKKKEPTYAGGANENLDTIRLMAAMLNTQDFGELKNETGEVTPVGERIRELMEEKKLSPMQLAEISALDIKEIKKILDSGKGARRDALIAVSLALSLDVDEVQRLLAAAGLPALYAKNRRDAACIFALMKEIDVKELNELLAGLEEAAL